MKKQNKQPGQGLAGLATGALTLGAAWLAYSQFFIDHNMALPPAIDSDMYFFNDPTAGLLYYYADRRGSGRPLVLIHSLNAAGSSYEMRPLFNRYRGTRPVYALDLPGFGFSERANRRYSPELYAAAIRSFLSQVVGQPADVVALSLGCEFVARAAVERPEMFHKLAFISPSGLTAGRKRKGSQRATDQNQSDGLYRLLAAPLWAQALYDLLGTRRIIRFFLGKSFVGPIDQGLADYGYLTAHRPGARHAPLHFVSGLLFTRNVRETIYEKLAQPVLVIYDRDAYVRFDALSDLLLKCPNWNAARITPPLGLPHFEQPEATGRVLEDFWA